MGKIATIFHICNSIMYPIGVKAVCISLLFLRLFIYIRAIPSFNPGKN